MYCLPDSDSSFLRQLAYEDAEVFGLVGRLRAPHRGEQGAVGDHLAGMAGQVRKQIEFLGREVDCFAEHGDTVVGNVDDEVAGLDGRGRALGSTPQMSAHARQQFLNAEGLCDVVVGAGIERFNLGTLVLAH